MKVKFTFPSFILYKVVEDRGGAMDKISGMIPPPPTMGDDSDKEIDDDDWD